MHALRYAYELHVLVAASFDVGHWVSFWNKIAFRKWSTTHAPMLYQFAWTWVQDISQIDTSRKSIRDRAVKDKRLFQGFTAVKINIYQILPISHFFCKVINFFLLWFRSNQFKDLQWNKAYHKIWMSEIYLHITMSRCVYCYH